MPKASLQMKLTDLRGGPIHGPVHVDIVPQTGEPGTGGDHFEITVPDMKGATELILTGITCRGGIGTLYLIRVSTDDYRTYSFFQTVKPGNVRVPPARLWVDPGAVTAITAPEFSKLNGNLRSLLIAANMVPLDPEDRDLAGLSADALYNALGPLRQSCLLNIFKKASHLPTTGNAFQFFRALRLARQDRCYLDIDPAVQQFLEQSPAIYSPAHNTLHEPLPNFQLTSSFKSNDAHANIQITLMRNPTTNEFAADVDIDEAAGIQHGVEVIRNKLFNNRTSPYLIREFLLAANPGERTLDPGYDFVF